MQAGTKNPNETRKRRRRKEEGERQKIVMSAFGITEEGSNAVLYTVLLLFAFLAFLTLDVIPLPEVLRSIFVPKRDSEGNPVDYLLSARASADAKTIAVSFFAGGMGAWVVYGTT